MRWTDKQRARLVLLAVGIVFFAVMIVWYWTVQDSKESVSEWREVNEQIEDLLSGEGEEGQADAAEPAGPVPINRATAAELERLPGIGPSKAAAIVAYREQHGPFQTPEDLMKVKGIGPKTFEGLRSQIVLE